MKFLIIAFAVVSVATAATFPSWQNGAKATAYAAVSAPRRVVPEPVQAYKKNVQVVAEPVQTYRKNVQVVAGPSVDATVLRQESVVNPDGFNYVYETSNGIAASASGSLKNVENVDALTVQGQYQFPLEDGTQFQLSYVADENGYQPQSDFLPVAPPVPEAILRSLQYIATHSKAQA